MSQKLSRSPASLLIVCIGNTYRSPMAQALAKRRWPNCVVQSVGICVPPENARAADQAIAVMNSAGIDISAHKPTPIDGVAIHGFEFVVALDKNVRRTLLNRGVDASKIVNLFIADPYGDDLGQYLRCANAIAKGLTNLSFPEISK